ncbi:MAG: peptide deformylase [Microgenomates group bacterium]
MLKIITVPSKILSQPTKPVKKIDGKIKKIIEEMKQTLIAQKDPEGVGLAAPQVGLNLSIFIIRPRKNDPIEAFINPKIIKKIKQPEKKKKEKRIKLEGCLSIPKIWGKVKRDTKVLLQYQTIEGETKTEWFSGFKAVIIQHEVDHLQGIVFTQRVIEQGQKLYKEKKGQLEEIKI